MAAPRGAARRPVAPSVDVISDLSSNLGTLPPLVRRMVQKISEAAATRDIENLRSAIDSNEVPPLWERGVRRPPGTDSIAVLKDRSFDKAGREMLAILRVVMAAPFVQVTRGPFGSFVWPAFALRPAPTPSDDERLVIWRCVRFADLGRQPPAINRVVIGSDGTWHSFGSDV